ncbi:uncharacterized protein LOC133493819 isoform X4 [Syngnathoides biaculeatus]|uniref:uncharacterized protein LOC133493819 isoform X4 n=1 Tax=Syngnathoides biaculeatus TaxID=300417 RepID=UPI002ADDA719|nr:uncharacterized protein LOC133493819 isoform X4 [Syngnathoides biaculeatus]
MRTAAYKEELWRPNEEKKPQRQLLDAVFSLQPRIVLRRADIAKMHHSRPFFSKIPPDAPSPRNCILRNFHESLLSSLPQTVPHSQKPPAVYECAHEVAPWQILWSMQGSLLLDSSDDAPPKCLKKKDFVSQF